MNMETPQSNSTSETKPSILPSDLLLKEIDELASELIARSRFRANPQDEWWYQTNDKWILEIMETLRISSKNLLNYREFRRGLIQTAAKILIAVRYADEMMKIATLQKPNTNDNGPRPQN